MGERMDKINQMSKFDRCIYHGHDFSDLKNPEKLCHYGAKRIADLDEFQKSIDPKDCENCENFRSRMIETPITIDDFEIQSPEYHNPQLTPVRIRLCEDDKTYFGIYLGDFPWTILASYDDKTKEMGLKTISNPAIFVPAKKKIYFGAESWWSVLSPDEDMDDIKNITDDDINGQWYVKMLEAMSKQNIDKK